MQYEKIAFILEIEIKKRITIFKGEYHERF